MDHLYFLVTEHNENPLNIIFVPENAEKHSQLLCLLLSHQVRVAGAGRDAEKPKGGHILSVYQPKSRQKAEVRAELQFNADVGVWVNLKGRATFGCLNVHGHTHSKKI